MDPDTPKRQRSCGVVPIAPVIQIRVKDGAYFCGLTTCGSMWGCAVCSAKGRATRADDLVRGLAVHYGRGGAVHLLTLTLPHDAADQLARLLGVERAGWKRITQGGAWTRIRGRLGIRGWVRAVEITHGDEHGWHPHFHILIVTDDELDAAGIAALHQHIYSRWAQACASAGLREPDPMHGVDIRPNIPQGGDELGRYVTKVQEGDWGVAEEITRGDLKSGRGKSRTPFEIQRAYQDWGEVADRELWREYLRATKGLSAVRWSRGLHGDLLPDEEEKTDEEAAHLDPRGELVGSMTQPVWKRVVMARLEVAVMEAAETGGLAAVNELLDANGCGWADPPREE
jgi:hypothetical protein